ncbi:MAG: hypothetical protein ACP5OX_02415 [Minisyncoccia bacterium]
MLVLLLGAVPKIDAIPKIKVEFPNPIPVTLQSLPVRILIPDPQDFGYPRVPVEIQIRLAGHKGVVVSLISRENLSDPKFLYKFLHTPISVSTEIPLPTTKKIGFYYLLVDIKCLYGPTYRSTFWYSYTENRPLSIIPEKIHICSGPEIISYRKAKFYGYSFSQAIKYDWTGKGVSYKFRIVVLSDSGETLYEEPAAELLTVFEEKELSEDWIEKEKQYLSKQYDFLLNRLPEGRIVIRLEKIGSGDWRWLFANQPSEWVAEHGVVIEAALPQLQSGEPFFPGLSKIEWPGMIWNPWGEFQLEVLSN